MCRDDSLGSEKEVKETGKEGGVLAPQIDCCCVRQPFVPNLFLVKETSRAGFLLAAVVGSCLVRVGFHPNSHSNHNGIYNVLDFWVLQGEQHLRILNTSGVILPC